MGANSEKVGAELVQNLTTSAALLKDSTGLTTVMAAGFGNGAFQGLHRDHNQG